MAIVDSTLVCNSISKTQVLIDNCNLNKEADAPCVIILQSSNDFNGFLDESNRDFIAALNTIGKTHYIYLKTLQSKNFGDAIAEARKALGNRSITALFLRCHGFEKSLAFGKDVFELERGKYIATENAYWIDEVSEHDYSLLDPKTFIVLQACAAGISRGIAEKIAITSQRKVFAASKEVDEMLWSPQKKDRFSVQFFLKGEPVGVLFDSKSETSICKRPTFDWMKQEMRKSEKGDCLSSAFLGYFFRCRYLQDPISNQADLKRSLHYLEKAGQEGEEDLIKIGLETDYQSPHLSDKKIFNFCFDQAETGDNRSIRKLAYLYRLGKGTPQSDDQAFSWYKKAYHIDSYSRDVSLSLATYYRKGMSQYKGQEILVLANACRLCPPEERPEIEALFIECCNRTTGGNAVNYTEALKLFQKVDLDEYRSQNDEIEKFNLLLSAAKCGHAKAAYLLGRAYENGWVNGVCRYFLACRYYQAALKAGMIEAIEKIEEMNQKQSESDIAFRKRREAASSEKKDT
jgi:TPR repeat protein